MEHDTQDAIPTQLERVGSTDQTNLGRKLCIPLSSLTLEEFNLFVINYYQDMDRFSRTANTLLFLLFCVLIVLQFQLATLDEGGQNVAQDHPEKPLFSKILMDTVSLLRKSHKSSWEKFKTVIHDLQMQFSPPNLE